MSKLFDIHIEIGEKQTQTRTIFYAKTILGSNSIKFEYEGNSPASAVAKVVADMEATGMWGLIMKDPMGFAPYPFRGNLSTAKTTTTPVTPSNKKDAEPVRKRPADLFNTPKGHCEAICISYDNFGVAKCSSICRGKK